MRYEAAKICFSCLLLTMMDAPTALPAKLPPGEGRKTGHREGGGVPDGGVREEGYLTVV